MTPHSLAQVAQSLGGGARSRRGWMVRCPSHDDHDPSLSLTMSDDGKLLAHCFAGCDWRNVMDALRKRGLGSNIRHSGSGYTLANSPTRSAQEPLAWSPLAQQIWDAAVPIVGTAAEAYLRNRGCDVPTSDDLRFLPGEAL